MLCTLQLQYRSTVAVTASAQVLGLLAIVGAVEPGKAIPANANAKQQMVTLIR